MAWSRDSWRRFEAHQQPHYPDPATLAAAERMLAARPPLVRVEAVDALHAALAQAQAGRAFLLQGGDCAESFADQSAGALRPTVALIEAMAQALGDASGLPVIRIGRIAGQFAKPRSADFEVRGDIALPAYRGDIVNGIGFDPAARRPDPARMLRAYDLAATTLRDLDGALFASHEALLLPYEQALTRFDPKSGRSFAGSAHFLWIGDRTRFPASAHVEFARGIANPIGVKCGPLLEPDALLRLLDMLDPERTPGRITLISRMGRDRIARALPPLVRAVRREGRPALWACDPMHGNTMRTPAGRKTRPLAKILAETRDFFDLTRAEGVWGGGLHIEMTGQDVTECSGGAGPLTDPDLAGRYHTYCDPRLNAAQAMEFAALAASALMENGRAPVRRAAV